jgi:DNA-binding CsgD family transcriptional regulator
LTGGVRGRSSRRAVAALFIQEVGNFEPLPGELLVKLYGLTMAETRLIALLAQGLSLQKAAHALGVARITARTHLQHIFAQTGTRRQAELIRLVVSAFPRG